jgi:hypothetical protein
MILVFRPHYRCLVFAIAAAAFLSGCRDHRAVTTYHYDNSRSGWNPKEEELTYGKVGSPAFGLLHSITLDDQVDAQPLIVPKIKIVGGPEPGKHDVVYVASESNTIYAIDASSGTILLTRNLGSPVPLPLGCTNNGPNVGINGTPVIDRDDETMYVIVYTLEGGIPVYRIHALDLRALTDKVAPVKVAASHSLKGGAPFNFDARYQRERPGLLLANGNVYAGFGSFCDFRADVSRGWVLGWKEGSLAPLPANELNDRLATSPDNFNLSSIWMSGYGLAADGSGSIYFITGNSDSNPVTTTYDGDFNVQESVVKLSGDLTKVLDLFTPSNVSPLDQADNDFGSGGAILLPEQPGPTPHLTVAAGKDGRMFVLNRDGMGGFTPGGPDKTVGMVNIGGCWCGQSYFTDYTDGSLRIVSSGGTSVNLWKVETSPSFTISNVGSSPGMASGQDPGFFTTVSSDGEKGKSAIIWAVSRPNNPSPGDISLYAFKGEPSGGSLAQLFQATAGTWPNVQGNANIVPVVANGKVYVASNKQLTIFGLH